jgi:hypothetical protein
VDDVANIFEVHAVCVFAIELCRLVRFRIYITFCIEKEWGKGRSGALPFLGQ